MLQVRRNVFETNSSSSHSITMCMASDYEAWMNGELYYLKHAPMSEAQFHGKKFVTFEEAQQIISTYNRRPMPVDSITKSFIAAYGKEYNVYTHEAYINDDDYLESYHETFTTPSGEKVIAFGEYGYDG